MTATRPVSVLVGFLCLLWGAQPAPAQVNPYAPSVNPYAPGAGYYGPGYGYYPARGVGGALQGQASKIAATGQYYQDIQQASMSREKVRQEKLVTQKKRVIQEMEYEDLRKARYRQEMENLRVNTLDRARRFPSDDEIWSGKSLNILMKSIMMSSSGQGPTVPLSETTLRGLNLATKGSNGNLGMAKDGGKIDWPDGLMGASFDDARNRVTSNFATAMKDVQGGQPPERSVVSGLKADLKSLSDTLDDQVGALSPDGYITARRRLNELKSSIAGLSDPRALRSYNGAWKKDVRNVSELVSYCQNNALEFIAAAAPGDRASYESAYFSLRSYERDVVQLASAAK